MMSHESRSGNLAPFVLPVDDELTLEQIWTEDAPQRYELIVANTEYLKPGYDTGHYTPSVAEAASMHDEASNMNGTAAAYKIMRGEEYVGEAELSARDGNIAELSYWVAEAASGQNIATRAAQRLVQFGLNEWGLERIILHMDADNIASVRIAERLGAEYIGSLSSSLPDGPEIQVWEVSRGE